eukprot:122068-Pelagomonas_calceolata.AAC.4
MSSRMASIPLRSDTNGKPWHTQCSISTASHLCPPHIARAGPAGSRRSPQWWARAPPQAGNDCTRRTAGSMYLLVSFQACGNMYRWSHEQFGIPSPATFTSTTF